MSADLLGTERSGHGVRVRDDGLVATIGYLINEAEQVWVGARNGTTVPAVVVGNDFESGLGLVKPIMPLEGPRLAIGSAGALDIGASVTVLGSDREDQGLSSRVVAKQPFAGRWEYLIDEAIFTDPIHDSWSGAALIDGHGQLCALGSLVIQDFEVGDTSSTVNMFVPIDLLAPVIDEICAHGRRSAPPHPWLGVLIHELGEQLQVIGVYRHCPADRAGLKPGDCIVAVAGEQVVDLKALLRSVRAVGSAGVNIPLTILRNTERFDVLVCSADRASYEHRGTMQ